jgi:uncharacterized DUF497 family protein
MAGIQIDWDARKDRANRRKHRISFAEAATVFPDEHALMSVPIMKKGGDDEKGVRFLEREDQPLRETA